MTWNLTCFLKGINGPKAIYVDIYDGRFNPAEKVLDLHSKEHWHCPVKGDISHLVSRYTSLVSLERSLVTIISLETSLVPLKTNHVSLETRLVTPVSLKTCLVSPEINVKRFSRDKSAGYSCFSRDNLNKSRASLETHIFGYLSGNESQFSPD